MKIYYSGSGDAQERLAYWSQAHAGAVGFDIETVSLKERMPLGFGIAFSPTEQFYFQVHPEEEVSDKLNVVRKWLSDCTTVKVGHNLLFDLGVFPLMPVVADALDRSNIWDTNVAARIFGYEFTALTDMAGVVGTTAESAPDFLKRLGCKTMLEAPQDQVAAKCMNDARVTLMLYLEWKDKMLQQYGEYFRIEMAAIPILVDMSMHGLAIHQQTLKDEIVRLEQETEFYRRLLLDAGIEKPGSPMQVGYTLAKRGNFLRFTRNKKQLSTREADLEFLDDPLATAVLQYRHNSKLLSTYLYPLVGEDRFYTEYYMDTAVGRLNSRNRNIQNIPEKTRHIFVPDFGVYTTGDYSQEHLRILAHFSGDETMKKIYEEGLHGGDIHKYFASVLFRTRIESVTKPQRQLAKVVNYAIPYGATPKTISESAKIKDQRRCAGYLNEWFNTFTRAADWIRYAQNEGMKNYWALPTLFGRRIRIPLEGEDAMRRKAVNYPILGSDGEVMKRALILCNHRGLGPPKMVVSVHDSITWDGDVKAQIPKSELEHLAPNGLVIPFEIKQTLRWE